MLVCVLFWVIAIQSSPSLFILISYFLLCLISMEPLYVAWSLPSLPSLCFPAWGSAKFCDVLLLIILLPRSSRWSDWIGILINLLFRHSRVFTKEALLCILGKTPLTYCVYEKREQTFVVFTNEEVLSKDVPCLYIERCLDCLIMLQFAYTCTSNVLLLASDCSFGTKNCCQLSTLSFCGFCLLGYAVAS